MQSYSNFSVGGSVSVNCHGRYVGNGGIGNTVRAIQLVTARGEVVEVTRNQHAEICYAVLGGYGGVGVVTEVELDLATNTKMKRIVEKISLSDYPVWFYEHVLNNPRVVMHNANLTPPSFDEPLAVSWIETNEELTDTRRLWEHNHKYSKQQNLIWAGTELPFGDDLASMYVNQKMLGQKSVVMRNLEASLDVAQLEPRTRLFSQYLLQEYFIPTENFLSFAQAMKHLIKEYDVKALNISIRHSPSDHSSILRWAPCDVFSFVLYHKVRNTAWADIRCEAWTQKLIDVALQHGGRYYLPYRLAATKQQFWQAYPEAKQYVDIKRQVDPTYRFNNALLNRYL